MSPDKTSSTTDPQDELLTEVDSQNRVLGSIYRRDAHTTPGKIYRTVCIVVKRGDEILIQKRSSTKDLYPNCWDLSAGGHVRFGEDFLETAHRELAEELELVADPGELHPIGEVLVKLGVVSEYYHVFEYILEPDDDISKAKNEVMETKWMALDKIREEIKKNSQNWHPRAVEIVKMLD